MWGFGSVLICQIPIIISSVKTPFGFDCPYFFGDYYRGRSREECRLIGNASQSSKGWKPDLCRNCPVPGIVRANACNHMSLTARVHQGFLGIGRRVQVEAYCSRSQTAVSEPHVGCGQCHPLPPEFLEKKS